MKITQYNSQWFMNLSKKRYERIQYMIALEQLLYFEFNQHAFLDYAVKKRKFWQSKVKCFA